MMSLAPLLTAVIGWLALGETLTGRDMLGMALTVAGIAWAVLERSKSRSVRCEPRGPRRRSSGLALGFGGALGQAGGLILSKIGMGGYNAFAATQVRVLAGIAGYVAAVLRSCAGGRGCAPALRDRRGPRLRRPRRLLRAVPRGLAVPDRRPLARVAGVAASIMALTPVLIIPLVVAAAPGAGGDRRRARGAGGGDGGGAAVFMRL